MKMCMNIAPLLLGSAELNLLFLLLSSSATAETQRKFRQSFNISVPDAARTNPQGEEYICTVQQLNLTEKAIYLDEFIYTFSKHGSAHHFLLYGCKYVAKYALEKAYWPCNARGKWSICSKRKHIPLGIQETNNRDFKLYVEPAKFPKDVAYGIGPLFEINYLMLEVHFMAEKMAYPPIPSTSGVVAHGSTLRPTYLAGMMALGGVGFTVPHGRKNFSVDVNCQPDLSLPIFPYAYWVHTHNLGQVVAGYKVYKASGKFTELARWIQWRPQPVILNPELSKTAMTIFPGDYIAAKCIYDSSNETADVHWGPRHGVDEMCNLFLFYFTLSANPKDLSISCVNEKSKEISKLFPSDAYVLPPVGVTSYDLSMQQRQARINPICDLYRQFKIKHCPFE